MDSSYLTLKSLHLAGVAIFLGNIVVTGWWKAMADRTRDARIIAFAQRQVTLTDWVFTAEGEIPARYWRLNRLWLGFGTLATALPLANLYVMVFKPV